MAKTQVMSKKDAAGQLIPENKLIISINYQQYVFPYDDGMLILNGFKRAEKVVNRNTPDMRIYPVDVSLDVYPLDHQEYAEAKLKTLIEGEEEHE